MLSIRINLVLSGLIFILASNNLRAEELKPDPAWQQGKLVNGFTWQLLATPQRPNDRTELRLLVKTGSMAENTQETGFAHLLPRLALTNSPSFTPAQLQSLWQQGINRDRPLPPAITSHDFTLYSLSLPNNQPDLMKRALAWLSDTSGQLALDKETLNTVLNAPTDPVATFPQDIQDVWWRYRLKGSSMLGHDPDQPVDQPVDIEKLTQFYQQWYTPDAMTLYVVGKIDSRDIIAQIEKNFATLSGKRVTPLPIARLAPLPPQPISLMNEKATQDSLALVWDNSWHPIKDSEALILYWRADLAREALFQHIQQALEKSNQKTLKLGYDCRVQYQRAQCAIHINAPNENLLQSLDFVAHQMAAVRNDGLNQIEFDALMTQKQEQLEKLFDTYARTDTDTLMSQRLRSQKSNVVDIAPEQYQKLRKTFLSNITRDMLNNELKQQIYQEPTLILEQPKGEPEMNVKALQDAYNLILAPDAPAKKSAETKPDDIPETAVIQES